jgi:hypothetical protein
MLTDTLCCDLLGLLFVVVVVVDVVVVYCGGVFTSRVRQCLSRPYEVIRDLYTKFIQKNKYSLFILTKTEQRSLM